MGLPDCSAGRMPMLDCAAMSRLVWLGPLTVAAAVLAVAIVQAIILRVLHPLPRFSESLLRSSEPALATALFVSGGVVTFALITRLAGDPVRTFRRVALAALALSCLPNVAVATSGMQGADWPSMAALMFLHVVAWAVTVSMLTGLTSQRRAQAACARPDRLTRE
jgi:hypothetical protein